MPGHEEEPIQRDLLLLQELDLVRNDLHNVQYKRFRWVHHIGEALVRDLRETESGFQEWLSRAKSVRAKLTGAGLTDAAEELRALAAEQGDYDPASFDVTIPIPDERSLCFQVRGRPAVRPPGPAQPAQRQSARLNANAEKPGTDIDYPTAGSLTLSEAARRKLWITSTRSGGVCIECPCPATVGPSSDTKATHDPIPRHFHVPPFEESCAQRHFRTVHDQNLTNREILEKYGKTVKLDNETPLQDKVVMDLHNRSVCMFEHRMSYLPWSQLTLSPGEEAGLPTRRTVLASALPDTSQTFHWPALHKTKWVVLCPVPDCTTAPSAEKAGGAKTAVIRHFEKHGLQLRAIPDLLRLFGYRVLGDVDTEPPATRRHNTPNVSDSDRTLPEKPQQSVGTLENAEILRRRIYSRGSKPAQPNCRYLVRGAGQAKHKWIGRTTLWMQHREQLYRDYDKQHPLSREERGCMKNFLKLERLRQKCRDLGLDVSPKCKAYHLSHKLTSSGQSKKYLRCNMQGLRKMLLERGLPMPEDSSREALVMRLKKDDQGKEAMGIGPAAGVGQPVP